MKKWNIRTKIVMDRTLVTQYFSDEIGAVGYAVEAPGAFTSIRKLITKGAAVRKTEEHAT